MNNDKNQSALWLRIASVVVMAGIVLLASGCGGSSSSNPDASASAGSKAVKAAAFANCMRAHGVDVSVGSNGDISSGTGGHNSSAAPEQKVLSAQSACRHLLPNGGQPSQSQQAAKLRQALKYTQCMRSHGVPNFPDPTTSGNGIYGYNIPNGSGINPNSSTYRKANQACQSSLSG